MSSRLSAWERAKRYGIDTTLLEMNIDRTPTERVRAMQRALSLASALIKAGERYYARIRKTD